MSTRPDIPIFRSIDAEATLELAKRANAFLADQGLGGQAAFLAMKENSEERESVLTFWNGFPAERYIVRVR